MDNGYYSHPMLVYLFNINITITKVYVLFVFCTYLNIVINYTVISNWNHYFDGQLYCGKGDMYECCQLYVSIKFQLNFSFLNKKNINFFNTKGHHYSLAVNILLIKLNLGRS